MCLKIVASSQESGMVISVSMECPISQSLMDLSLKDVEDSSTCFPQILYSGKTSFLKFGKITLDLIVKNKDLRICKEQIGNLGKRCQKNDISL
jgi:hypothetical protein